MTARSIHPSNHDFEQTSLFARRFLRFILLAVAALALGAAAPAAFAQSAHWTPPSGTLEVGKVDEIGLEFDDCEPKSDPNVPSVPGLTLQQQGRSENISMVNFKTSRTITYTFAAQLASKQSVDIPAFDVDTDKGTVHVAAAHFDPADATIGNTQQPASDVVRAKLLAPHRAVWAGEVFPLTFQLEVRRDYYNQILSKPEWSPAPLAAEDWTVPTRATGNRVLEFPFSTRAYAKDPGTYTIGPARQQVSVQTGVNQGFFFSQPVLDTLAVSSDQPTLLVKALPKPAPAGFNGAVGQFTFTSKVVPQKAHVGDPITWTLDLKGTGNWPDIAGVPAREVPKSFEVVQPRAKRASPDNKLFDASVTEDVVLVPKEAGLFTLPSVTFAYFDPETGAYKTITTKPVMLDIEDAAPAPASPATPGAAASGETKSNAAPAAQAGGAPALPTQPALLPSDPIGGRARALHPFADLTVSSLAVAPLGLLLAAWLTLAGLRARDRDPLRPRREARIRLRATLEAMLSKGLAKAAGDELRGVLRSWQGDTAILLGLSAAAPAPDDVASSGVPQAQALAALWRETEAALYSQSGTLPSDWVSRAIDALEATPVRPFQPFSLFHPRHLTPWFFAFALVALATPRLRAAVTSEAAGKDPAKAYAAGDFASAADAWQQRLEVHPTDWRARNNLGLAMLQQGQDETAATQLAVAFLHAPDNDTVLQNFRLAMQQARLSPDVLGELALDHPLSDLARLASPAGWQLVLIGSGVLGALALGIALLRGYGVRIPGALWLSPALIGVALLCTALSVMCLGAYGIARDPKAMLVAHNSTLYSIPTEAETTQKTSALSAGVLGRVDRSYLGWRHVVFPGGQAGWVRSDDVVMLWK